MAFPGSSRHGQPRLWLTLQGRLPLITAACLILLFFVGFFISLSVWGHGECQQQCALENALDTESPASYWTCRLPRHCCLIDISLDVIRKAYYWQDNWVIVVAGWEFSVAFAQCAELARTPEKTANLKSCKSSLFLDYFIHSFFSIFPLVLLWVRLNDRGSWGTGWVTGLKLPFSSPDPALVTDDHDTDDTRRGEAEFWLGITFVGQGLNGKYNLEEPAGMWGNRPLITGRARGGCR